MNWAKPVQDFVAQSKGERFRHRRVTLPCLRSRLQKWKKSIWMHYDLSKLSLMVSCKQTSYNSRKIYIPLSSTINSGPVIPNRLGGYSEQLRPFRLIVMKIRSRSVSQSLDLMKDGLVKFPWLVPHDLRAYISLTAGWALTTDGVINPPRIQRPSRDVTRLKATYAWP